MPNGNADLHGGLEAGDQLAAINGNSSIGMKVDDICAAMGEASARARVVELTFLRYIGPCRPLETVGQNVAEEDASIPPVDDAPSEGENRTGGKSESSVASASFNGTIESTLHTIASSSSTSRTSEAHLYSNKTKHSSSKKGFGMKKFRLFGRNKKNSR